MDGTNARIDRQNRLTERDFRFAVAQYGLFADHVSALQGEREVWIRHSIIATFAFFGWIAVYRDNVSQTFMLEMFQLQTIYFVPLVFNLGGALRFYFIQREINRTVDLLTEMEREILCLADEICEAPKGRGIRDRHWHWPSIAYWIFIVVLSGAVAGVLTFAIVL